MSLYDAYVVADSALGWRGEVATRVRDFLARNRAAGQSFLRFVERAVESSLPLERLKDPAAVVTGLKSLLRRLRHDPSILRESSELETLFQEIIEHGKSETIEEYSTYLFTVETRF